MPESNPIAARITELLKDSLLVDLPAADTDLVESGAIDSAGFMELFCKLEEEFGIEIRAEDLNFDNFRTAHSMAAFVVNKQGRGGGR